MNPEYRLEIKYPLEDLDLAEKDQEVIEIAQFFSGKRGDSGAAFGWRDLEFLFPSGELCKMARKEFIIAGFIIKDVEEYVCSLEITWSKNLELGISVKGDESDLAATIVTAMELNDRAMRVLTNAVDRYNYKYHPVPD